VAFDPHIAVEHVAHQVMAGIRIDTGVVAAELGVSRATLHRRAGNREALLGEAIALLGLRTFAAAERNWDAGRAPAGAVRSVWIMEQFRAAVAASAGVRRLLDEEPAVAIRVLTDPLGRVQPRLVERCAELLRTDVDAGAVVPLTEVGTLAYAVVRLAESFLYSDVLAARAPDLDAASTLIGALVTGGRVHA
jgi:AcrR family transcriptional regulator